MASTEILLVTVFLSVGVLAGLATYRDAFVQELGDVAVALNHIDQSYEYTVQGTTSTYDDIDAASLDDPAGQEPAGLSVTVAVGGEGTAVAVPGLGEGP
jgi:hypothetical protein